jgi:hypothetical protein
MDIPRCDRCSHCYVGKSLKYKEGNTHFCKLNGRDVGQSHFGLNSPKVCPLRIKERVYDI